MAYSRPLVKVFHPNMQEIQKQFYSWMSRYLGKGWGGGEGGAMIFSFDKSTSLEGGGGSEKNSEMIGGVFKKMKGKNEEIIIAHPLGKF